MRGESLHWFRQLINQADTGDMVGALQRSVPLALIVMVLTVAASMAAGLSFRRPFRGSGALFYTAIASLVAPGYVLGIGIGLMFEMLGIPTSWYGSALGAQLSWTLPFGLLIMFAVFGRLNGAYEEASRDMGASRTQTLWLVVVPIVLPGIIAVALFGFTLSYDEFARTLQTTGGTNTLPIEIWSMTQNVTSPSIYALGTLTTAFSFIIIGISLSAVALIQRRRMGRGARTA
jgi:putative spermidine/putrescine transport system permease protein